MTIACTVGCNWGDIILDLERGMAYLYYPNEKADPSKKSNLRPVYGADRQDSGLIA